MYHIVTLSPTFDRRGGSLRRLGVKGTAVGSGCNRLGRELMFFLVCCFESMVIISKMIKTFTILMRGITGEKRNDIN